MMVNAAVALLFTSAVFGSANPQSRVQESSPVITTTSGDVAGDIDGSTWSWKGIPFAAPPVGELRWQPPQDPESWTGVRQATSFGPECLQANTGDETQLTKGSEDCLYLNIWAPQTKNSAPKAVMFWIHGGGNTTGSAAISTYNGARMAAQNDVVVVSVQYRLSFMGYFNHPALETGDALADSGNFGLLDHIKALNWVQDNIAAFGGDPDRVMVFGESAGGFDTWALLASGMADGLFHRAAIESGCPLFVPMDASQARAQSTLEALVVADGLASAEDAATYVESMGEVWVHDYLYNKPADEIHTVLQSTGMLDAISYYATEDGFVMPVGSLQRLADGDFHGVPTIVGVNRDEMKLFYFVMYGMGPVVYHQAMATNFGDQVDEVEALYPRRDYTSPLYYNRFTDVADGFLELSCGVLGAMIAAPHMPVWLYRFEYDDLVAPYNEQFGACHAMELPFVFGNFTEELYTPGTTEVRTSLSQGIQARWTCLAKNGDPNVCGSDLPWPTLDTSDTVLQRTLFDSSISLGSIPESELAKIQYWDDLYGFAVDVPLGGQRHQQMMEWLSGGR